MEHPVPVTFSDLNYSVPVKTAPDGALQILRGVSGSFRPGRMTALMGPSGSGKTTLLDLLAGRKSTGTIEGHITMAGKPPTTDDLKQFCGYVEQFDTLVGELTVAQMLAYTAELKLPSGTTAAERDSRCQEVLKRLGLESCKDTVIGNTLMRGISGGQAKRVNIALALITRPAILFLDEPTSGLDSHTANDVIVLLKQLALEGRTVVCTIHSPTGFAFSQFDDLVMLKGGRKIFEGALSSAKPYFEGLGRGQFNPNLCSLPEWLVDLTAGKTSHLGAVSDTEAPVELLQLAEKTSVLTSSENGDEFAAAFEASGAKTAADSLRLDLSKAVDTSVIATTPYSPPSQLSKLMTLLKYRMAAHYKDAQFLGPRLGDKVLFSVLILTLYWDIGDKTDAKSINSIAALTYMICALCGYGAAAFVPSLTLERALFYRELADGCYSPGVPSSHRHRHHHWWRHPRSELCRH